MKTYELQVSSSCCPGDTPGLFNFGIPWPLKTSGEWSVAVKQISVPKFWFNIKKSEEIMFITNGILVSKTNIPSGCYENVKVLIDIINKKMEESLKSVGHFEISKLPHLWYDSLSKACFMFTGVVNKIQPMATIFSNRLQAMLGFENVQNSEAYQTIHTLYCAYNSPNLEPDSIQAYMKTNLAQNPLVSITYKNPKITYKPNDMKFHPLRLDEVSSVKIELVDEKGNPVVIKKGDTTVKLVFRSYTIEA